MAFNRYTGLNITTTTDVITCPASTVMTIIGITVANVSGIDTVASIKIAGAYLLKDFILNSGSAIVPVGGEQKIVLVTGDTLNITANYGVDVIISVLEQSI